MEYKLSPSLMCMNLLNIESQINILNKYAYMYHIDIIDGIYFKNFSLTPPFVREIRKITDKYIDVHLMLIDPIYYIDELINCGADYITLHSEKVLNDIFRVKEKLSKYNRKLGIILSPATPINAIKEYIHIIDKVTVLTMDPGYSKGKFIPEMLDKIIQLKTLKEKNGYKYLIDIDGACYDKTIPLYKKAGTDIYTIGSRGLFSLDDDLDIACNKCLETIKKA